MADDLPMPEAASMAYASILERAESLLPALRARAALTEASRETPQETLADLHQAGLFRCLQPRRVGGGEFDYVALVDIAAVLARADASVAWVFGNLASHHWMLAMFPPTAQDAVWSEDRDALIASAFVFPAGRAVRVAGGYRLSGKWPFSSGVGPSAWNMVGAVVAPQDEAEGAEYRIFLIHKREYEILDTWHVAGLAGTGSNDIACRDVFVADHMTLGVRDVAGGPTPGAGLNPNPLYRIPVFALFPFVLSGAALGNAQGCLDDFVEEAGKRASRYNQAKLSDYQSIQIRIAAAGAKIDAARLLMRAACVEAMEDAARGVIPSIKDKTRYRRDGAFAVGLCTEAVDTLFAVGGAGALYTGATLQRRFRDAHAINSHIAFSFDAAGANFGRVALGFPSENVTL